MTFYVGIHMIAHVHRFDRCMISVNRLWDRVSDIQPNDWIMDSGAFTQVLRFGEHSYTVQEYADAIHRWNECGNLLAAVSQDYMCEPKIRSVTGLSVEEHQRMTVERYVGLREAVDDSIHIMPVIQGYEPGDYIDHIEMYGDLLKPNMWVGVGSVCKRNSNVGAIESVLGPIRHTRPDLLLHGFGVKLTALASSFVHETLHTSDSMAWSFAARRNGGDANCWKEAKKYVCRVDNQHQDRLPIDHDEKAKLLYQVSQTEEPSLFA